MHLDPAGVEERFAYEDWASDRSDDGGDGGNGSGNLRDRLFPVSTAIDY